MIAKLGPWVRTVISASSKGCPDRLTTYLLLFLVSVPSLSSVFDVNLCAFLSLLPCLPSLLFEWPPLFLWHNHSSFANCLILTFVK